MSAIWALPFEGATTRGARAVREERGRAAVGAVDEPAEHLGADHEHVVTAPALHLGRGERQGRQEARACRPQVHRARARGTEVACHQRSRVRQDVVRRHRRHQHEVQVLGCDVRLLQRRTARGRGEVLEALAIRHAAALVHARAMHDPLLGHAGALGNHRVRDHVLRNRHGDGRQGGRALLAVPRHGGHHRRRCGVGGGGIAHGRPRVRPQEVRAMHRLPPSRQRETFVQGSSGRGRGRSPRSWSRRARRARASRRASERAG